MIFAQSTTNGYLSIDGLVYGYNYEPSKKLLQKEKQIKVEGVLDNVAIQVIENGKIVKSTKTKSNGSFLIQVKMNRIYTLEFSKPGYTTISLIVDLKDVPKEAAKKGISFTGAELILNSFQLKNKSEMNFPFGKLYYNTRGNFIDFDATKFLSKRQREYISNPVSLMMGSVQKNKSGGKSKTQVSDAEVDSKDSKNSASIQEGVLVLPKQNTYYDTINKIFSDFKSKAKNNPDKISDFDLKFLEENIKKARMQFEKNKQSAQLPEDSIMINEQEELLNSVELELFSAKKMIALQKNEISTQKKLLLLALSCVLLLSVMIFLIFRFNREKKKTYILLKDKNKKITDSINYASRIQESILPSESEIKKQLPESFVFFKPRDVVSGDFYWLSNIKDKTIIACVDCTGHGVPGAFMSLIGNTLLNEIVNEKEIIDPSLILKRLHTEIVKALHQNSDRVQSKDGMEMSLCVIDNKAKVIEYAGAMNPLYIVKDSVVNI
ncbi:MAG TPA: SpoIIE family protein phosphatase, partial [Bacteroidia bacterium]|nr:SpoIIE family protein phosphatase [Bacteroidia bacterium]